MVTCAVLVRCNRKGFCGVKGCRVCFSDPERAYGVWLQASRRHSRNCIHLTADESRPCHGIRTTEVPTWRFQPSRGTRSWPKERRNSRRDFANPYCNLTATAWVARHDSGDRKRSRRLLSLVSHAPVACSSGCHRERLGLLEREACTACKPRQGSRSPCGEGRPSQRICRW